MKTMQGTVTRVIDAKTAKVEVARNWQHPVYKKYVKRTQNYLVDSTGYELAVGDTVVMAECRPLSRSKRFQVVEKA